MNSLIKKINSQNIKPENKFDYGYSYSIMTSEKRLVSHVKKINKLNAEQSSSVKVVLVLFA